MPRGSRKSWWLPASSSSVPFSTVQSTSATHTETDRNCCSSTTDQFWCIGTTPWPGSLFTKLATSGRKDRSHSWARTPTTSTISRYAAARNSGVLWMTLNSA